MNANRTDVVLIGAGIMSATLGTMLKQLDPGFRIEIFERLEEAATESSDAWNNAGTGHSAFCELNYTPEQPDGSIDTSKAVKIAESFEQSKQFWAYLVQQGIIDVPADFIHSIPHMSFVWGEDNVRYLKKRHAALTECHLFRGMQYTEDASEIRSWAPLLLADRSSTDPVAATKMDLGTDVNFGALTRSLFECLRKSDGVNAHFNHEVLDLQQQDGFWQVRVKDVATGEKSTVEAPFVFIGAGGGSLPLLLKSGIPEGKGFGGFPVSGQWLRCTNEEVIAQHEAKVYGTAAVGAPPMSVPHLDTRWIKGKRELLFGPYAGFTTRFLKHGSVLDLFRSIKLSNLVPMISAGLHNIPLTKYLIEQVRLTPEARLDALRGYYPAARAEDWELAIAGYRVQVIKKDEDEGGILEFGTEVVSNDEGSIAALLGASPGASTAVSIMLGLLGRCFPQQMAEEAWKQKLRMMVPSYGRSLGKDAALCSEMRAYTGRVLGIPQAAPGAAS
ncbi:MAG: malate dehydrogenase (quinone) [Chitinophagaceae bacterium]|nr:MAG: malate dehydrogenase (quinone) [Chitinophagaceae bacterium]